MEKKKDEKVKVFFHPYVAKNAGTSPQKPKPKPAVKEHQAEEEPKKNEPEKIPAETAPDADSDMVRRMEEIRARMRSTSSSAEGAENNSNTEVLLAGILVQMEELTSIMKEMKGGTIAAPVSAPEKEQEAPAAEPASTKTPPKDGDAEPKKKKKYGWIGEIAFYMILVVCLLGVFFVAGNSEGTPKSFAGFSAFTVLTGSMEDVIPQGSLVITKSVDPNTLEVGDDITFMSGPETTITHRIISITEKYQDTNARAFETQGVMNPNPDKELVAAANVVGIVVFHNKTMGDIANFLSKNWPFILFVVVVIIILIQVLKFILRDDSEKKPKEGKKTKEKKSLPKDDKDKEKEDPKRKLKLPGFIKQKDSKE